MTDGSGTTGWTFDNANRCTQIAQPNGTVSYGYDNANRRTSMTHSATGTWSYSFDAGNRLTSTTNPNSETTSLTLDAARRITRQDFSNTTYALNTYDTANRITNLQDTAGHDPLSVVTATPATLSAMAIPGRALRTCRRNPRTSWRLCDLARGHLRISPCLRAFV